MLAIGDYITIRYSKKLAQNGHQFLANKTGVVTRIYTTNGEIIGVRADVMVMRRKRNYYIPVISIEGPEEINKMRSLVILRSTIL